MITIFCDGQKVHLPHAAGMVVAPQYREVQFPVLSGGVVRQVIGSLTASSATAAWSGTLPVALARQLLDMHSADPVAYLTVDDTCYETLWSVTPGVRSGDTRPVTLRFGITAEVIAG